MAVTDPGTDVELVLAGEFPTVDHDRWAAAVAAALDRSGGLGPEEAVARLRSRTYDGIVIEPLYTADDVPSKTMAPPVRSGEWDVRQRVDVAAGDDLAIDELERGATSVLLDLGGVEHLTSDVLDGALDGVLLDLAPVVLDAGARWREAADALGGRLQSGSLGADPLGVAAAEPGAIDVDEHLDAVAAWIGQLAGQRPDLRVITVDGTRYHEAGASDAQQLGCAVAAVVEYLRDLDRRGVAPADALERIELRLAATADQFATIATFRAVRRLWTRVAELVGAPGARVFVHAVTSRAMMTAYDPWVNALRSTVACFAAGIAGADAVTVLPHDVLRGPQAGELGRRVGRNTQSVLLHESHLGEVTDPAGGSWFVESYTDQLAAAAWAWFQEIEAAGGSRAAAELAAARLDETRRARRQDVDTRRAPLTGLSEFPNVAEPAPPPIDPVPDGPLALHRWSEDFESLRRRVDAAAARGRRPAVFLATIGAPAITTPRVMFARNLFEVAGLATIDGPTSDDPATIAEAFASSGATVACLCSSDGVYAEHAVPVAGALLDAGAAIYVAGRPKAVLDELAAIGVDRTIHVGADVRATLTELLELLELP